MYGALWRAVPGPSWFKAFVFLCLLLAVTWVCFEFFFPWLSTVLPFNELTVGDAEITPVPGLSSP